jgi:hypothetical protein
MSNLNRDVLYLIFEQLQDDKNTLYSCLLVNKTWCETTIPILWRNPWKSLKEKNEGLLLSVIISHLSNVTRKKIRKNKLLTNFYQKPLFNYISFCRHLNLKEIRRIIIKFYKNFSLKVLNVILRLFINKNMKFTHLYIRQEFDKINHIRGAASCFSGIEFLSCKTDINDKILSKLIEACHSIKNLRLFIRAKNNNYGIIKLIKTQKKLLNVSLVPTYNDSFYNNTLENSLVKHAKTIQYFKIAKHPTTNILSSLINLKVLELGNNSFDMKWNCLKNLSLPFLQILKANFIPSQVLTDLIENTNGTLLEIENVKADNKGLIQAIYRSCPNLKYLKLLLSNSNIMEFETLLIKCQYLNELYIIVDSSQFDWDKLFDILTKSSSTSLFKFKFDSLPTFVSLKLFFDNWKGRQPMFLQIITYCYKIYLELIEKYKAEGVINKFDYGYLWK